MRIKPTCAAILIGAAFIGGCRNLRYENTAAYLDADFQPSTLSPLHIYTRNMYFVPARDILLLDPVRRAVFGSPAWNADGHEVPDGSFYTNRLPEELTPERVARGPCTEPPPEPPFTVIKKKSVGATAGFIGRDARGREYLFKPDDRCYPELGSGANVIASRIYWALGYHVPAEYVVTVSGTGDPAFEGRRASASAMIEGGKGHIAFDALRYRRELRGLGLAAAWVNDTDRNDHNTLVVFEHGHARVYLVDFNSALGSWQGRPKESWRGWQPAGDVPALIGKIMTLGLWVREPDPRQPVISPAVGRFEGSHFKPAFWTPQWPNNAYAHMTSADRRWIASKIALLDRPHLEAIVAEARYSDPADAQYIVDTLMQRREKILRFAAR